MYVKRLRLVVKSIASVSKTQALALFSARATRKMSPRVLSIQSHVVHGYVGNKSATFPLQLNGFEVDAINSVQFSNHTGYKAFKGQVLDETQLNDVFDGLTQNGLETKYSHLLTGYIGNANFLRAVANILKTLRAANPDLTYVCDPVMGDDGFMYVPKELLPIYRDEIIPLSNITTPNQYEAELLTGKKIATEADVWEATVWFHDKGVNTVALSSTDLGGDNELLAFLSHKNANTTERFRITIPKQAKGVRFTGTGDLFAALFLANSYHFPDNVGRAFERTTATLQAVIARTVEFIPQEVLKRERKGLAWERELKIVQSKKDIEEPKIELVATRI